MPSSSTWAGQWWAEAEGGCCGWTEQQWPRAATGHGVWMAWMENAAVWAALSRRSRVGDGAWPGLEGSPMPRE